MCNANRNEAKATNGVHNDDEGLRQLMGAMYNDLPAEMSPESSPHPEMSRPPVFAGRFVTKVEHASPLVVTKRFVNPQMIGDRGNGFDPDRLLRKLFCVYALRKVVLLVTPKGDHLLANDKYNVHAYLIENQWHLGVTSLTASERDHFVRMQRPNNYTLIFCTGYIHLEDAFMNAPLKKALFGILAHKSNAAIDLEYRGKRYSLLHNGGPNQAAIEATRPTNSGAEDGRSREVKIAARNATVGILPLQMQDAANTWQINTAAREEVPQEIHAEQADEEQQQQQVEEATSNEIEAASELQTNLAEELPPGQITEPSEQRSNEVEDQFQEEQNNAIVEQIVESIEPQLDTCEEEQPQEHSSSASSELIEELPPELLREIENALIKDLFEGQTSKKPAQQAKDNDKKPSVPLDFNKAHKAMLQQMQWKKQLEKSQQSQHSLVEPSSSRRKRQPRVASSERNSNAVEQLPQEEANRLLQLKDNVKKTPMPVTYNKAYKAKLELLQLKRQLEEARQSQDDWKKTVRSKNQQLTSNNREIKEATEQQAVEQPEENAKEQTFNQQQKTEMQQLEIKRQSRQSVSFKEQQLTENVVQQTSDQNITEATEQQADEQPEENVKKPPVPQIFNQTRKEKQQQLQETESASNNQPQVRRNTAGMSMSVCHRSMACSQCCCRLRKNNGINRSGARAESWGGSQDELVKYTYGARLAAQMPLMPQWVTAGLNSKHRNYLKIPKPKSRKNDDQNSAGDGLQGRIAVRVDHMEQAFECEELLPPRLLRTDSVGSIAESTTHLLIPNSETVIAARSSQFERIMQQPVAVPSTFSKRARSLIEAKLTHIDDKLAFLNLGSLIRRVNSRPVPHRRHLLIIFRLFALLDVKLFVRPEFNLPDHDPTPTLQRCRIECFFFEDRSDFIFSMTVLRYQMEELLQQVPEIVANIRYCQDAFDLTRIPSAIRNYMRCNFKRTLKDLIAEYCYKLIQHETPITAMPYAPTAQDILGDDAFMRVKQLAIRRVRNHFSCDIIYK